MAWDYKPWYVSPSKLGVYNDCPAQYHGRYVKKGKEKAEQEPAPILDSGKLVHRVLEIAAQKRIDTNTRDKKPTKKEFLEYLEIAVMELPKMDWQKPGQCTPEIVESAAKVLGFCWKSMSFANVVAVERTFQVPIGPVKDDKDAVVIKDAGLSGIIDRIDEIGDRIKIIDYKSGWSVMSKAEAELDPQVNFYLVVGAHLFPGRPVDIELRYLNRGNRVGPIEYTPERREWLINSYVKPLLSRMASWDKYPETPGAPQCYSCFRKAECLSFAKMIKGTLAPISSDMGRNLALYERLGDIEKNIERIKKPLSDLLNTAIKNAEDGELFAGDHRCRMVYRNKTEYPDLRRTAAAAAKAILSAKMPSVTPTAEPPADPEELRRAYLALSERNAKLLSASIEAATAFEVACKIGKAQAGLVDAFTEGLPEEVTLTVAQAIDSTSSNGGYYYPSVERLSIPFRDRKPTKSEIAEADAQLAENKLLPPGAMPLLDDSHEKKSLPLLTGGPGGSTSGGGPGIQLVTSAPVNGNLFPDPQGGPVAARPREGLYDAKPVWAQPDCGDCGGKGVTDKGSPCMPCVTKARVAT